MTNPIATNRAMFEKAFAKALDDMERCWNEDSTQADLSGFKFDLTMNLADGTEVRCAPAARFAKPTTP